MKCIHIIFFALLFLPAASCVDREAERKPVPPKSKYGKMPWNPPMPGEGGGQFGGMLQRR